MRYFFLLLFSLFLAACSFIPKKTITRFQFSNRFVEKVGRFDTIQGQTTKVWNPGAYVHFRIKGNKAKLVIEDEVKYMTHHNYILIMVDGVSKRMRLNNARNEIVLDDFLSGGVHEIFVFKETEAGVGYIQFSYFECEELLPLEYNDAIDIEFIGDSITAGNGADTSLVKCKTNVWYDQHSAYQTYGMRIGRNLNKKVIISAVSGIGVSRSCCGMDYAMSNVFDHIDFQPKGRVFVAQHLPKLVVITLGQNDGKQDTLKYDQAYVEFATKLAKRYPDAKFLLCSSPMANDNLKEYQIIRIPAVTAKLNAKFPERFDFFLYKGWYNGGCDKHPTVEEHFLIMNEIIGKVRSYF